MSYSRDDFKKLRYNVYDLKKGMDLDFGDLATYPIFNVQIGEVDNALLFKWIVYMYDNNSPLINITDIRKRGIIASNECGFPKKAKGKLADGYKEIALFDTSIMLMLGAKILQYCRLLRDPDYLQLAVFEMRRIYNNERIIDPKTDTKEMLDLIKGQTLLGSAIDSLRVKFLNGDDSDKTYAEVLDSIENDNMELSPEQIRLNVQIRTIVSKAGIYGKGYHFEKNTKENLTDLEKAELVEKLENNTEECRSHFKALGINEVFGS